MYCNDTSQLMCVGLFGTRVVKDAGECSQINADDAIHALPTYARPRRHAA